MYDYTIVGAGTAGLLALACLPPEALSNTLILESTAVGGALTHEYPGVVANISKAVTISAFKKVPRWSTLATADFQHLSRYSDGDCPLLCDIMKQLRVLTSPLLSIATLRNLTVASISAAITEKSPPWKVTASNGEVFESHAVFVATGASPRRLDLPHQSIPLKTALDPSALPRILLPDDRVVVFGTSHSGTLVLRNLRVTGCTNITSIYKNHKGVPFVFNREGESEGLKAEAAAIADEILRGDWGTNTPTFIDATDFAATYRALCRATAVVYAIGFDKVVPGGEPIKPVGITDAARNLWGIGIGFPTIYMESGAVKRTDIGFSAFVDAVLMALSLKE